MAFTPATSLQARSAMDLETAAAAAAAVGAFVGRVHSPNVVVIGCANEDVSLYVHRLPSVGETVAVSRCRRFFGGKGANQAVQAALLIQPRGAPQKGSSLLEKAGEFVGSLREVGATTQMGKGTEGDSRAAWTVGGTEQGGAVIVGTGAEGITKKIEIGGGGLTEERVVQARTLERQEKTREDGEVRRDLKKGDSLEEEERGAEEKERMKQKKGEKVALICALGADAFGQMYRDYLESLGVVTTGVFTGEPGSETGRATITIDEDGQNTIAYFYGANDHLLPGHIHKPEIKSLIEGAKVVVCENGVPGGTSLAALRVAKESGNKNIKTIFTPSPTCSLKREIFYFVDYVIVNSLEARQLLSLQPLRKTRDTAGNVFEEEISFSPTPPAAPHTKTGKAGITAPTPAAAAAEEKTDSQVSTKEKRRSSIGLHGGAISGAKEENWPTIRTSLLKDDVSPVTLREHLREIAAHAIAFTLPGGTEDEKTGRPYHVKEFAESETGHKAEEDVATTVAASSSWARQTKQPSVNQLRGACEVIITKGACGCVISQGSDDVEIPAKRSLAAYQVVDTVGAGDSFVGAFAYFLGHREMPFKEAAEKAGIVASYAVQKEGANQSYADRSTFREDFFA